MKTYLKTIFPKRCMSVKRGHGSLWIFYLIILAILISGGSIQNIDSYQNLLNYGEDKVDDAHVFPNGMDQEVTHHSMYQAGAVKDEVEEELEGEICDPSDKNCGCVLSFIGEEYRIIAVTSMLMAVILSFVIYDFLKIRKEYQSQKKKKNENT